MKLNITILGAGSMGAALAVHLAGNGHNITMWTPFRQEADTINTQRELPGRLPGVRVPDSVYCTDQMEEALREAQMVVLAVPAQTARESARQAAPYIKEGMVVASCSKGIEDNTCLLLSDVLEQELPQAQIAALSGPSYAIEIARGMPTAVVAAAAKLEVARAVQDAFMTPTFRVYTSDDILGVEMGGALKNVIAICAGISDGLGFGDDTKAALLTRGITEIARLGKAMGANPATFSGLTGMGDLILTCTGAHSRNRQAGRLIGQGKSVEEAIKEVNMVVEGISTTKPAYELATRMNVSMPITTEAYEVLFKGKDPRQAVIDLMTRDKKSENEELYSQEF